MMSMNKLLIPSILVATILVAGVFAFIPVQKATTVHEFVIAALTGDAFITNQDISEELKDKLKLMVATDDDFFQINDEILDPGDIIGFTIEVEAFAGFEHVPFNLKEVYVCGSAVGDATITIEFIHIEDVLLDGLTGAVFAQDIKITDVDGSSLGPDGIDIIDGTTCVDIISALAKDGRAGAVGLGSDTNLVIELDGDDPDFVDFVKCIAFTPNEAEILFCNLEPIFFFPL